MSLWVLVMWNNVFRRYIIREGWCKRCCLVDEIYNYIFLIVCMYKWFSEIMVYLVRLLKNSLMIFEECLEKFLIYKIIYL